MQVRRVPALAGWRWVTEGFAILAASPLPLIATGILMLFSLLVVSALPTVGDFLPLVLSPALSFGYLQAIRLTQDGQRPPPSTLFSGLRPRAGAVMRSLLLIGLINATASAFALAATVLIDGGEWLRMLMRVQETSAKQVEPATVYAALTFMLLYAPLQVALWYAPLFAGLHRTPPLKALVFSAVAVWRNKAAFLMYFAGWFAVAIGLTMLVQLLVVVVPAALGPLVMAPALLLLMAALYCSFWLSYRDTIDPIALEAPH